MFFRFISSKNDAKIRWQLLFYKWFPAFIQIIQKQPPFSANSYEKYIVSKEYCIARHDDKMCFLPNCRYHIILIGNLKELLQKLDAFCFNYQHVDCLYTLFKYRFSGKIVATRGDKSLINCRGQFISTSKTEEWKECPASQKRDSWGKSTRNICWAPSKRPNQRKLDDQSSQKEMNKLQVQKTKFEIELIKIVDCFLDGHGNYTSILVSFKIKSL